MKADIHQNCIKKLQFLPHREHISSPLQRQTG